MRRIILVHCFAADFPDNTNEAERLFKEDHGRSFSEFSETEIKGRAPEEVDWTKIHPSWDFLLCDVSKFVLKCTIVKCSSYPVSTGSSASFSYS